jgi:hypothetical protein
MTVEAGRDYVFAPNMTYHGNAGIGDGCLLGTMKSLLMIPLKTMSGAGRKIVTSTYTLGGKSPAETILNLLSEPSLNAEGLEEVMKELVGKLQGSVLADLTTIGRVKVKAGMFSRGIYYNEKASGLGGWSGYPLKGKPKAEEFLKFYAAHPKFVSK